MNPQIFEKAGKIIIGAVGVAAMAVAKKYGPQVLEQIKKLFTKQ